MKVIRKSKYPKVKGKEWLYVGHYIDTKGRYILKVGTTDNLTDRQRQHHAYYTTKTKQYIMPEDGQFIYDWYLPLSKYNTLRFEDKTRQSWKESGIGQFISKDRFYCAEKPDSVTVTIRKTYVIPLK